MAQRGLKGIRASFIDAARALREQAEAVDPPPEAERNGVLPGSWPGAPCDRLPPDCPVVPLGVDGKTTYFVDTLGQLISLGASEWSKKTLVQLFALQPNYLYWAWPRWSAPNQKAGRPSMINGLEADDAIQALVKAAAKRGLFSPIDRVRGRGAWVNSRRELVWHSGDWLWMIERGKLTASRPGEVDGTFYPQRPRTIQPWQEAVDPSDSPAHEILAALRSWAWERPALDPVLALGAIGCMFLGAALPWRPHLFVVGDKGVGKSTLQFVVKTILGDALQSCADTTAAGIYQRVKQDSLPVGIDELEANADNRRVKAVVDLARLASSGAMMFRGGSEHEGVEFRLQNTFLFSAINPPPLQPQDRSRMAILNLGKLPASAPKALPTIDDSTGRMILRALMDAWPQFDGKLAKWKDALWLGGQLEARAQDTYGTLLAVANLLLGDLDLATAGFDISDAAAVGELVAHETSGDRAEQTENWRGCLEHLLGSTIEQWRDGQKPTIGAVLQDWEERIHSDDQANARLELAGLRVKMDRPDLGADRAYLCVPVKVTVGLAKMFAGTRWGEGTWATALKQAPPHVVIRDRGNGQNVRISRVTQRCLFVDLKAYDEATKEG